MFSKYVIAELIVRRCAAVKVLGGDDKTVEMWKQRDPVVRFRKYLERRGLWDTTKEEAAAARWNDAIGEAIQRAEAMPPPAPESIFDGVYAELPWNLKEQRDWLTAEGGEHAKGEGRFPL